MDNLKLTNYRLNRSLFSLIEHLDTPVYIEDKTNVNNLLDFYIKQKNKKKYYELINKIKLLCLFNKFI